MSAWAIYFIGQADVVKGVSAGGLVLCAFIAFFVIGNALIEGKKLPSKWFSLIPITLLLVIIFVPSSKTVAAMYAVPAILNNENVKALPDDVLAFIRKLIREYTDAEKL